MSRIITDLARSKLNINSTKGIITKSTTMKIISALTVAVVVVVLLSSTTHTEAARVTELNSTVDIMLVS